MKTKEELNALKAEVKALNEKLAELTEEELDLVSGGQNEASEETEKIVNGSLLTSGREEKKPTCPFDTLK